MKTNYFKNIAVSSFLVLLLIFIFSFKGSEKIDPSNKNLDKEFLPVLSDFHLYEGPMAILKPAKGTELYELTSHLFVDYAEKQRLIKLPPGTTMINKGDGLPDFPEGTIIVKTFYWYKDKKKPSLGRNIVETRLLIKIKSQWKVGTYRWNSTQTDATLITKGTDVNISWKNTKGIKNSTLFHIPSNEECSECHQSDLGDFPIGLKLRNMNFDVIRNGTKINQLTYFQNLGWLDPVDVTSISTLPDWENNKLPLDKRARAYLDMNCAHCHNPEGSSSKKKLYFGYELPLDSTEILLKKAKILKRIFSDDVDLKMPSLGTSVKDVEGINMIKQYLDSLH